MNATIENLFSLKGKVALITGGNRGIGRGIGRALAGSGASVVIGARDNEASERTAKEITNDFGTEVFSIPTDVRNPSDIEALVNRGAERFGRLDIIVANAGISFERPPSGLSIEEWDEEINTNLRHTFILAKTAYPHLVKAGGGKIITLGSMTSLFGIGVLPGYGASKGGVMQLSRSLAVAWGKDNIQVNCLLPGFIDPGLASVPRREVPGFDEAVVARTPAGRWGTPDDLAGIVIFLASAASNFITGAAIPIDGGYAAQG
jgi:2-dehydro-3-deoxy-D-gluconate 5-dehydrogenase